MYIYIYIYIYIYVCILYNIPVLNMISQISNCKRKYFPLCVLYIQHDDGYLASRNMQLLSIIICYNKVVFRRNIFTILL